MSGEDYTEEDIKALLEAAYLIRRFCDEQVICKGCPFLNDDYCVFNCGNPEEWEFKWDEVS